jgi:acyl-CoA synthetase (AMP-forming)/AMP-acid ligase II
MRKRSASWPRRIVPRCSFRRQAFCLVYLRKCTREQFSSIRYRLAGAEKLRPALAEALEKKFGIAPLEGYGCTEMGPVRFKNPALSSAASGFPPMVQPSP